MSEINLKGFKGIRFNSDKVDLSKAVAPPYDVFDYGDDIDTELRSEKYNIVHIQKPDGSADTMYSNAADKFNEFTDESILIKDDADSLYLVSQEWGSKSRIGIIAAVRLDESYTRIRPHEKTKPGPIEDRFNLTKATGLNIGSIFLFFNDNDNIASNKLSGHMEKSKPLYDFIYPEGIRNRIYEINDKELISNLNNKTFYIADGHHRYRTMLDYRNLIREKEESSTANEAEYTMMFIVPHSELTIYSYHRLLKNIDDNKLANLLDLMKNDFEIAETPDIKQPPRGIIGYYFSGKYYSLKPKDINSDQLDVEVLQNMIFTKQLDLTVDKVKSGEFVSYVSGDSPVSKSKELVDKGTYQAMFLMNPLEVSDIEAVSDNGKTLPPKSTFFYPKILSGVVLNKVTDTAY